ncbi:MAG: PKD domain-containing protein, partial [Chitinophagaceae bacterium]
VQLIAVFQTSGQHQCLDTVIKRKYFIVSHPIPDFKVSSQIGCTPFPAVFSDSTKYTPGTQRDTLLWQFGDGSSTASLASSIMHVYAKDGVFNVKLVAKDWNGCKDSIFKPAYVQSRKPNAFYQVKSLNACIGQQIFFSNLSVGSTGLFTNWSFGDGDTAATFHGTHAYKAVGSYTARMVVFDSTGCSDTMIKVITVTKPTAAFSLNDTLAICPPLIVKFTSTSTNAVAYTWDFKNTGSAAIANPSSTFSAPGVYNVQLIVTDAAGCTDTARHNVRVLGYAGAFDYPIKSGCVPLTVNFTSNIVGIPTITWDFADGTTEIGVGFSATHTYLYPGVYVPKLIFSDGGTGCKASSVGLDTIKVDAVIAGFEALPPCEKTQIQLIDTSFSYFSAMKAWKWNFGNSGAATGNPVNRTYANAGKYPVTLIATNAQGCSDTLADSITIYPLPLVVAMPDTSICVPDALYLTVEGAKTYFWQPPNDLSCTNCASPRANPNTAISYIVTGTDAHGCANKDTVNIGMQTKATFKTNGDGTICLGDKIQLFAAGATLYDWTPPESLDSPKSAHPLASPKVNTTYIVTGREGSCLADTHLVHIVVRPLPTVNAGSDVKVIAGKTTILQASGSGISGVLWSGDSSLSCYTCFAPEAKPRKTTTYYVKAYNEFGCTSTDSVTVFVLCDGSQLFIPNTFSPNGDGYNDRFFPRGDGIKLITSFRIYSRWGELMYERKNMEVNDESGGWDGIHNGRILTPDVFVYVIEANCESGAPLLFKGDVTLLK